MFDNKLYLSIGLATTVIAIPLIVIAAKIKTKEFLGYQITTEEKDLDDNIITKKHFIGIRDNFFNDALDASVGQNWVYNNGIITNIKEIYK